MVRQKILIAAAVLLVAGVFALWFIGGETKPVAPPAPLSAALRADEHLRTLVTNSNVSKQAPLLAAKTPAPYLPTERYSAADLHLGKSNSVAAIQAYGQSLGDSLRAYSAPTAMATDPLALTLATLDAGDATGAQELAALAARHLGVAKNLMALEVPPGAATVHLQLVNAILGLAELDFYMSQVLTEPIIALESSRQYPARRAIAFWAVGEVNQYFAAHQVRFAPDHAVSLPANL